MIEKKSAKLKCQRYMTFTPLHQQIFIQILIFKDFLFNSVTPYLKKLVPQTALKLAFTTAMAVNVAIAAIFTCR